MNIMNYLKISLGIFLALAASRFVPHPPNFTSLLALSFYVPALLGKKYIPALVISFIITDLFFGIHQTVIFTWGSIILISLMSSVFKGKIYQRIVGALGGVLIFFIITNFGVWSSGMYPLNLNGLITCYTLALPFLGYNLISTLIFSTLIETVYKKFKVKKYNLQN